MTTDRNGGLNCSGDIGFQQLEILSQEQSRGEVSSNTAVLLARTESDQSKRISISFQSSYRVSFVCINFIVNIIVPVKFHTLLSRHSFVYFGLIYRSCSTQLLILYLLGSMACM